MACCGFTALLSLPFEFLLHLLFVAHDKLQLILFIVFFLIFFMCKDSLPACLFVHYLNAWCLLRPEEGIRSPGNGVTGCCELGTEPVRL